MIGGGTSCASIALIRLAKGRPVKTLLLMSIIWATLGLPVAAARYRDPVKGVRTMSFLFACFVVAYFFYVAYGHTVLFPPR